MNNWNDIPDAQPTPPLPAIEPAYDISPSMMPGEMPLPIDRRWRGRHVVGMALGALGLLMICMMWLVVALQVVGSKIQDNAPTPLLTIGASVAEAAALVGSVYFFGLRRRRWDWRDVGLVPADTRWMALAGAIGLVSPPIIGYVALLVRLLAHQPSVNPQDKFLLPSGMSGTGMLFTLILVGLVVPFAEELFFRGVVFAWLRDRWSVPGGAILSAMIFGLAHFDLSISIGTFLLGLVLAWIYLRSRSLWPAVIIHAMNNSIAMVLLYATHNVKL